MNPPTKIRVEKTEARCEIRLNNPPINKLDQELLSEITAVLEALRGDDHLKLIVLGSDIEGLFSEGMHVEDRTPEKVGGLMAAFGHLLYKLNEQEAICVCEVDGNCFGSAMELAVYCDMIVASGRSAFGHPGIKAGLFPPVAAAVYPHLIGRNRTIELLITARELTADEARTMGLINRVWPTGEFKRNAQNFFEQLEQYSAISLRLTKKAVEQALYERVPVAIRRAEDIYLNELMRSHDAMEGLKALMEEREPQWKNK